MILTMKMLFKTTKVLSIAQISKEEVLLAFRKLKNKKAVGQDGIIGEMLKNSRNYVTDFFVTFLMLCLRKEFFQLNGLNLS